MESGSAQRERGWLASPGLEYGGAPLASPYALARYSPSRPLASPGGERGRALGATLDAMARHSPVRSTGAAPGGGDGDGEGGWRSRAPPSSAGALPEAALGSGTLSFAREQAWAQHGPDALRASGGVAGEGTSDDGRKSLESSQLLTALRSQLRDLDDVHARLQLHLSRAISASAEATPASSPARPAWPPRDEVHARTHTAGAVAQPSSPPHRASHQSPSRDPDEQSPSAEPTPSSAARGAASAPTGGGLARESPARLEQIKRILRVSGAGAGLWDDGSGDEQ